ncbi:GPVI protein, partial [Eudromia elegans]|nr:GPVI protein [Eudromia elegans]
CLPAPGPPPSLSLHPDQEVALGDTATLRCRVPRSGVRVSFYKDGSGTSPQHVDRVKDVGELPMEVTRNSAGRYRCRYEDFVLYWTSDLSDPVDLVVLDPHYSPPTVSLSPGGRVKTGANVTISCRSPYGATFILHKKGCSV